MRIIAISTLKEFWELYPDSEQELKTWFKKIKNATYKNPNEVIADTPTADTVGDNRVVFNICHNKYRLIVVFRYKIQMVFIRFVGTHKEYDKIKDIKKI
jgi:mRNA interferase HigB